MLSYLKNDQNPIPAASDMPTDAASGEAPLSSPHDYLTVSGHGQKLRQSTILLIVVFGVSVLGVWFMIKKTTPVKAAAANDDQKQLEAAIAQLNSMQSEMNTKMDSVVGRFYQFNTVGQVDVSDLKKNPFKRERARSRPGRDLTISGRIRKCSWKTRCAAAPPIFSCGRLPPRRSGVCCMINDKVLYVGDEINGLTVSIENKIVTLGLENINIQLKMDE
jgi:hypothetical protein